MLEIVLLGVLVFVGVFVLLKGITLVRDNEVGIVTKNMLGNKYAPVAVKSSKKN